MLYSRSRARSPPRTTAVMAARRCPCTSVALFAPGAAVPVFAADAVAPVENDQACNNVESGADSPIWSG